MVQRKTYRAIIWDRDNDSRLTMREGFECQCPMILGRMVRANLQHGDVVRYSVVPCFDDSWFNRDLNR